MDGVEIAFENLNSSPFIRFPTFVDNLTICEIIIDFTLCSKNYFLNGLAQIT